VGTPVFKKLKLDQSEVEFRIPRRDPDMKEPQGVTLDRGGMENCARDLAYTGERDVGKNREQ